MILALGVTVAVDVEARPVTYTLRTATDGKIGGVPFARAEVTFTFVGDTQNIETQQSTIGKPIYVNSLGQSTVTIVEGGKITVARVDANQLYVRYDTGTGIVSFGSQKIGPTYPVALGCEGKFFDFAPTTVPDCSVGDWSFGNYYGTFGVFSDFVDYGTADAIADAENYPADIIYYSSQTLAMVPPSLARSGVLTGSAHVCAGSYVAGPVGSRAAVCPIEASSAIDTDQGPLYFQDISADGPGGAMGIQVGGR